MARQSLTDRIEELEDTLKQRDRRISELREEIDEERELREDMADHVRQAREVIESWKEAFAMARGDDGNLHWGGPNWEVQKAYDELVEQHNSFVHDWNRLVPEFNAKIKPRGLGRPLAASDEQQRKVRELRKAGASLRAIASQTSLGLRSIRTIIEKQTSTDRTSKHHERMRRLELNKARMASWRARKRTRDELPKRITHLDKQAEELERRLGDHHARDKRL